MKSRLEVPMTAQQIRSLHSPDPDVRVLLREMQRRPWKRTVIVRTKEQR